MHCLNHAVFLPCGLNLDVQNHPSLVSELGNKATEKQVTCGKHRIPKSSGLFATDTPPHALLRPVTVGAGEGL